MCVGFVCAVMERKSEKGRALTDDKQILTCSPMLICIKAPRAVDGRHCRRCWHSSPCSFCFKTAGEIEGVHGGGR